MISQKPRTLALASLLAAGLILTGGFSTSSGQAVAADSKGRLSTAASTQLAQSPTQAKGWQSVELKRFPAAEANQGVAVDSDHFYAITNREIGKYRKDNGERVAGWKGEKGGPFKHLNAGLILDGKLYCAHSNFPTMPEESSVEIWDPETLEHIDRHEFKSPPGSLTWAVRKDGSWFACFAHYRRTSDPAKTVVVKYDANWREQARWHFPTELVERFTGMSSSGGSFGPGGHLFATGHDAKELYVLELPEDGDELVWIATIPISSAGQAFAWDPSDEGVLYSIQRRTKEVIVSRITKSAQSSD